RDAGGASDPLDARADQIGAALPLREDAPTHVEEIPQPPRGAYPAWSSLQVARHLTSARAEAGVELGGLSGRAPGGVDVACGLQLAARGGGVGAVAAGGELVRQGDIAEPLAFACLCPRRVELCEGARGVAV